MLEPESDRWAKLRDAYGAAESLVDVLRDSDGVLANDDPYDLWGRLCHQGDVYTASYASVPYLLRLLAERGDSATNAKL